MAENNLLLLAETAMASQARIPKSTLPIVVLMISLVQQAETATPAQAINHEVSAPAQFACGICDYIGRTAYALRVHKNIQ
ncbi:hypothetical protein ACEPAF_1135 [Sanghuangporus sanghuang]